VINIYPKKQIFSWGESKNFSIEEQETETVEK
jgi:hypothetical protein